MEQQTVKIFGTELKVFQTAEEAKKISEIVWCLCETEGIQYIRPAIVITDVVGYIPVMNDLELELDPDVKRYMFITTEGYTYQPDSDSTEPDIENCQVIGCGKGSTAREAFENMVKENDYLLETTFNEVDAYELTDVEVQSFCLDEYKTDDEDDDDE